MKPDVTTKPINPVVSPTISIRDFAVPPERVVQSLYGREPIKNEFTKELRLKGPNG